jgi:hypothetical protein
MLFNAETVNLPGRLAGIKRPDGIIVGFVTHSFASLSLFLNFDHFPLMFFFINILVINKTFRFVQSA